ncbi:proteasome assembly chaperone 4 [Rhynchophorus ferrugineus]|uniref:Proteasome assembly chaperone 4 n=1 Tax=Rhynchophorus ferrugineus TaxID=354439 RepID=A0A834HTN2_RHYFE|nr:hypothetical protein GWI33_019464 [Rhynchophorus ferrugineus]
MVIKSTNPKIEFVPPETKLHAFFDVISEKKIIFQVIKMQSSVMIFVNNQDVMNCDNIVMAMKTRFSDTPCSTTLMGNLTELVGNNIASRLSKKLEKPVYLSFNLDDDKVLVPLVEERLFQEIQQSPECF